MSQNSRKSGNQVSPLGVTPIGFTALLAGGLGAAASIGSALIGSNAASNASNAQVALGRQALQQQQALFNQGLGQQSTYFDQARKALEPYATAGESVLPTLQGLITPGPNQNALLSQTPGFQFASQYGTMAATNALASRGLGASAGPVATAVSGYNQGLASNTWQSVVNALQGYAGLGGNAAATLGGIAGSAGNADVGAGVQAGQVQGNTLTGIGQSQAAGILGSANAISGGVSGVTNSLSSAALLSGLQGGGGLYNLDAIGKMPATGAGSPNILQSNMYAISQGINPFQAATGGHSSGKGKQPILVGENGPELFVPDSAGTIVPYKRLKKAMDGKNCLSTRGLTRKLGTAA